MWLQVAAAADAAREPTGNAPAQGRKRAFIQTMGCQMNVSDSEVGVALLTLGLHRRQLDQCVAGAA